MDMLNSKIILGLVFAASFSMFIGFNHPVYAVTCTDLNAHDNGAGCQCDPGFTQNGGQGVDITCIKISVPVGGMGIPIDTTALLLAGMQGSGLWMIPAIVIAGAGIGIFSFKKSKKKED